MVVSAVALTGCSLTLDPTVDDTVRIHEGGSVRVESCRLIGYAITTDEDGDTNETDDFGVSLDEVWTCTLEWRGPRLGSENACYVLRNNDVVTIVLHRLPCGSVSRRCPLGGRPDRDEGTTFLGVSRHPDLVLELIRENDPRSTTVRVDVSFQGPDGARERCGYLNVEVLTADDGGDPTDRAAEVVGDWPDPPYSFSFSIEN